jgi:hypothetical protein
MPELPEALPPFGSNLNKSLTAGRSLDCVFNGSRKYLVLIGRLLVFVRQQLTVVRPDGAVRFLLTHKISRTCVRPANNFTEKEEKIADSALVRLSFCSLGQSPRRGLMA